jgi:hypothetical protein
LNIKIILILIFFTLSFVSYAKSEGETVSWVKTNLYDKANHRIADFYHIALDIKLVNFNIINRCKGDSEEDLELEKVVIDSSGLYYYVFSIPYHDDLIIVYTYNTQLDKLLNRTFISMA